MANFARFSLSHLELFLIFFDDSYLAQIATILRVNLLCLSNIVLIPIILPIVIRERRSPSPFILNNNKLWEKGDRLLFPMLVPPKTHHHFFLLLLFFKTFILSATGAFSLFIFSIEDRILLEIYSHDLISCSLFSQIS